MASCSCPVFRPSLDEFRDFQAYVRSIEEQALVAGICKIIPPEGWWRGAGEKVAQTCDVAGPFGEVVMPGSVKQIVNGARGIYTVSHVVQSKKTARALSAMAAKNAFVPRDCFDTTARRSSLRGDSLTTGEKLERRFWQSLCAGAADAEHAPLYGADLEDRSVFAMVNDCEAAGLEEAPEWQLDSFFGCPLRSLKKLVPGVTAPMLYLGSWRALFAWHVEDQNLYSINVLHAGEPKSWYALGLAQAPDFERYAESLFPAEHSECKDFLRHKTTLIDPKILRNHGFDVVECVQSVGEIMLTFPLCYHAGFNHGFNIAESTNFATDRWPTYGRMATVCKCQPGCAFVDVDGVVAAIERKQNGDTVSSSDEEEEEEDVSPLEKRRVVAVVGNHSRVHVQGTPKSEDDWVEVKPTERRRLIVHSNPVSSTAQGTTKKTKSHKKKAPSPSSVTSSPPRKRDSSAAASPRPAKAAAQPRGRCGECAGCRAVWCRKCQFCLDMPRFGGKDKLKQACLDRRCLTYQSDRHFRALQQQRHEQERTATSTTTTTTAAEGHVPCVTLTPELASSSPSSSPVPAASPSPPLPPPQTTITTITWAPNKNISPLALLPTSETTTSTMDYGDCYVLDNSSSLAPTAAAAASSQQPKTPPISPSNLAQPTPETTTRTTSAVVVSQSRPVVAAPSSSSTNPSLPSLTPTKLFEDSEEHHHLHQYQQQPAS